MPISIDPAAFAAIFSIELAAVAVIWGIGYALFIARSY